MVHDVKNKLFPFSPVNLGIMLDARDTTIKRKLTVLQYAE